MAQHQYMNKYKTYLIIHHRSLFIGVVVVYMVFSFVVCGVVTSIKFSCILLHQGKKIEHLQSPTNETERNEIVLRIMRETGISSAA